MRCTNLVELVHRTTDGSYLVLWHATHREYTIQNLPVVDLDSVVSLPAQSLKDLARYPNDLRIRQHRIIYTSDIEIALVELAHSSFRHSRLISSVDFCNVVALDALDVGVHGKPSCEGDSEIVAEGAEFAALVCEVVDEFAVFAVFAREDFLELEDGSV